MNRYMILASLLILILPIVGMDLDKEDEEMQPLLSDEINVIEMSFPNQAYFLLAWSIMSESDFNHLGELITNDIKKEFPNFEQFLRANDKEGESLSTERQDIEVSLQRIVVYLKQPISSKKLSVLSSSLSPATLKGYKGESDRRLSKEEIVAILERHKKAKRQSNCNII